MRRKGHEEDSIVPVDKYKVTINLVIEANSADEAWEVAKSFLTESIDNSELEHVDQDSICDFDILDVEPADLDF